jgi:hypothetical protein
MNGYLPTMLPRPVAIFLGSGRNLLVFNTGYIYNITMPQTSVSPIWEGFTQNCHPLLIQWCRHTRRQALQHAGCKNTKNTSVIVHAVSLHLCHTLFACIGIGFLIQRGDLETLRPPFVSDRVLSCRGFRISEFSKSCQKYYMYKRTRKQPLQL